MVKPTPGPWTIHLAQTVSVRPLNSDVLIARVFGAHTKAEANARLIALTPELAEACIVALIYLEDGAVHTATERLRAIVAKIKGDQHE